MIKNIYKCFMLLAVVLVALPACKDENDDDAVGSPSVSYVRLVSDSTEVTSADPGSDIAIVGSDLQGLQELYFNGL